jgi:DNA-binding beta-propeller fold protein YncE
MTTLKEQPLFKKQKANGKTAEAPAAVAAFVSFLNFAVCLSVVSLSAVSLPSCATAKGNARTRVATIIGRTGSGPGELTYPRPVAVASDGSVWVCDKTGRVQRFSPDGKLLLEFHMPEWANGKPVGMRVGPDGNLYVADTHYHRVVVFDAQGKELRRWGTFGQAPGQFIYPTDVAFAPDGRVFVSEYGGNDRISVFSPEGKFVTTFGQIGEGEGQFSRPAAMAVDAARSCLYVADACNHRIARYGLDGKLLGYFGASGREAGQLKYPYGLALLADGRLAVSEFGNHRVQVFDSQGRSLAILGQPGKGPGELVGPWGIAADAQGRLYVVDSGNNRVQVWQL